jgi:hypothetical protein
MYFDIMVNNKYAIAWTYYDGMKSMNVNLGFLAVTKKYSTCILFYPTGVTMELANTIAGHEFAITIHYYYQVTSSNTHHLSHVLAY